MYNNFFSTLQGSIMHYYYYFIELAHPANIKRQSCVHEFGMSIGRNFVRHWYLCSSPVYDELDGEKRGYIHGHVCNILQPRAHVQTYITVFRRGTFRNSSRAAEICTHRGDAHSCNTYIRNVWQTQRDNALTGEKGGRNRGLSRELLLL